MVTIFSYDPEQISVNLFCTSGFPAINWG